MTGSHASCRALAVAEPAPLARPLRTLHLTNSWHETSGGIATFYRALMDAANRRGHFLRLVVPGENDRVEEVGAFARIYYVKSSRAPLNSQYRMIYPGNFLGPKSALQKILVAERPDLVEVCDKYTLTYFATLIRRGLLPGLDFRPVVVGLSCERMDANFRTYLGGLPFYRRFCAAYMKWLYFPFFDHHIANSQYTADELRTASQGQLVRRQVWIRPMGVHLSDLSPDRSSDEKRRQLLEMSGGRPGSVLLLYVGRLAPEKNLQLLFQLFARLAGDTKRDYRLLVAGDGIERERWEHFCKMRAPGRTAFLGHVRDRNRLADLLANADAFVHPNPDEPFGIAPLEAMASGLPLVAPDRGGVTSYANPENAWLTPASVEGFARAIEALLSDEHERNRRIRNALRTCEQYSWENVAPSFLDLYAELHSGAVNRSGALPEPAFASTPAEGLRQVWFHGVSQSAEKIFQIASTLFSR